MLIWSTAWQGRMSPKAVTARRSRSTSAPWRSRKKRSAPNIPMSRHRSPANLMMLSDDRTNGRTRLPHPEWSRAVSDQIEATLLPLGLVRPLGAGRSAMPHGFLAHRARFATTRRAGHHMPVGQPLRDGRFWPDAASLVPNIHWEYGLACPSSQMLIPGLTSGQNRSVSVVQFGRKLR